MGLCSCGRRLARTDFDRYRGRGRISKGMGKYLGCDDRSKDYDPARERSVVRSIAFHPDGVGSSLSINRTATVWDASSGNELFTLYGHTDIVEHAESARRYTYCYGCR